MIRALLTLLLTLPLGCAAAPASPPEIADRAAVLATVEAFFTAMATKDAALAERSVVPEGVFVSARWEGGKRVQKHFSNREWIDGLGAKTVAEREEFTGEPTVLVAGDTAVVWAPYAFYVDGAMHHTGVDVFDFVRTDSGWRISGGAYSVIPLPAK